MCLFHDGMDTVHWIWRRNRLLPAPSVQAARHNKKRWPQCSMVGDCVSTKSFPASLHTGAMGRILLNASEVLALLISKINLVLKMRTLCHVSFLSTIPKTPRSSNSSDPSHETVPNCHMATLQARDNGRRWRWHWLNLLTVSSTSVYSSHWDALTTVGRDCFEYQILKYVWFPICW